MEITKISIQTKNPERVNLYIDGRFYRGLDRLVAIKLGLRPGLALNPKLLNRLETSQSENGAWDWALRSLQTSPKSQREMRMKLNRRYPPELVQTILDRLISAGLLDDQKLADQLVSQLAERATKSSKEIRLKLKQRGFDEVVIKAAMLNLPTGESAALHLARIKNRSLRSELAWPERFRKIASYLARKGFSYPEIRQAVTPNNLDSDAK